MRLRQYKQPILVVVGTVLSMLAFSQPSRIVAECGIGCWSDCQCIHPWGGGKYAIEDVCPKIVRMDPGNEEITVGDTFLLRFQPVSGMIICGALDGQTHGQASCSDPTGPWSTVHTTCWEGCDLESDT